MSYPDTLMLVRNDETGLFRWERLVSNGRPRRDDQGEPIVGRWYTRKAMMEATLRKTVPEWWRFNIRDETGTWEDVKPRPDSSRRATLNPPAAFESPKRVSAGRM